MNPGAQWVGVCFIVVLTAQAPTPVASADAGPPTKVPGAVEAVSASLDVEKELLAGDLESWKSLGERRGELVERTRSFYEGIDEKLQREGSSGAEGIKEVEAGIDELRRERETLTALEREVLERIRERRRRIALIEQQLTRLAARVDEAAGPMSGTWDVSILPVVQRGRFFLTQTGTLLSGTYELDGGFSGSLQGTLVNRKVVLERIDSRLGRWGRYEGFLSQDGTRIRGSWFSLELAGQSGGEGQWNATRSDSSP